MKKMLRSILSIICIVCILVSAGIGLETPSSVSAATKNTAKEIALNKKSISVAVGNNVTLKLTNAKGKVTWKSSNKSVAKVSSKGVVKGVKIGTATITALYKGKRYLCKVEVTPSEVIEYISDWDCCYVEYSNDTRYYRITFSFRNEDGTKYFPAPATITLKIENDKEEIVYANSCNIYERDYFKYCGEDDKQYYGVVYINLDNITKGSSSVGTVSLGAYIRDQDCQFGDIIMPVTKLPTK